MKPNKIVLIGVGGIGSHLASNMIRMTAHMPSLSDVKIVLVDGDEYQRKNKERQIVPSYENKAKSTARIQNQAFNHMRIEAIPIHVGPHGEDIKDSIRISSVIEDGDWVLLCVDNNKTRLWVSKWVQTLENTVLIDGGNELMSGSVQLYIRQDGKDLTPTIEAYNPDIANPQDAAPQESCEVAFSQGETQLLMTNLMVASIMLAKMWCLLEQHKSIGSNVTFFDLEHVNQEGAFARSNHYPIENTEKTTNG